MDEKVIRGAYQSARTFPLGVIAVLIMLPFPRGQHGFAKFATTIEHGIRVDIDYLASEAFTMLPPG